jgi:hypothetical protein
MELSAIPLLPPQSPVGAATTPEGAARAFEAMLWEMLVRETHLLRMDDAESANLGMLGSMLDQVLASQLAGSVDLGIGRIALAGSEGGGR